MLSGVSIIVLYHILHGFTRERFHFADINAVKLKSDFRIEDHGMEVPWSEFLGLLGIMRKIKLILDNIIYESSWSGLLYKMQFFYNPASYFFK